MFVGKARSLPLGRSLVRGPNLVGYSLAPNITLNWKRSEGANTLAYYDTKKIMALKSFIVQAHGLDGPGRNK
jgi:hypothetical protein